jgi:acetoacetyl-CoA synthetase
MDDYSVYNGKINDLRKKMSEIVESMKVVGKFEGVISMPRFRRPADISKIRNAYTFEEFCSKATTSSPFFEQTSFRDPFMIAYSSGTTGTPKCIVHSNGGALINSAEGSILHEQLTPNSVILQYTTAGWIMYFLSVMGLFPGSRVVLYDGSPLHPNCTTLIHIAGEQKATKLGIIPRLLAEVKAHGIVPRTATDLSNLKLVTSTGMDLSDQLFEWFYDEALAKDCQLGNIAGGTDLVSI